MPFTMLVPTMSVFLPFLAESLHLLFPSAALCCGGGGRGGGVISFSGKSFMAGLGQFLGSRMSPPPKFETFPKLQKSSKVS